MPKLPTSEILSDSDFPSEQPAQKRGGIAAPLAPEDFYYEGSNLVFTETYHRKRGYCCNSGCRHCPFGEPSIDG